VDLLQNFGTLLEMRSGFPSIVLIPIPCPLDQVLLPLFSQSLVPNILDFNIFLVLNLLGRGGNS
jgi:hypothetical protein